MYRWDDNISVVPKPNFCSSVDCSIVSRLCPVVKRTVMKIQVP